MQENEFSPFNKRQRNGTSWPAGTANGGRMLDQLIESTSHAKENRKRGGYLLTTLALMGMLFSSGLLWSMFAKDLGIGDESLELSELVTPLMPETTPPPKQEMPKQANPQNNKSMSDVPMRKENLQSMDETPVKAPTNISTVKNNSLSRPAGRFEIGDRESDPVNTGGTVRNTGSSDGTGLVKPTGTPKPEPEDIEPPKIKKPEPTPEPVRKPEIIRSPGVLNGKATYLATPSYPAAAKAIRAGGQVTVQITIDENGNVVSAKAVKGHPMLLRDSENAARQSRFSPTFLGKTPVKVTGIIVYNFNLQ